MSRTVSLQQECDEGMSIWPHSLAMSLQHSRSSTVSAISGSMQAITGEAQSEITSDKTASLPVHFNINSLVCRDCCCNSKQPRLTRLSRHLIQASSYQAARSVTVITASFCAA